jgi:hypothetical protein
MKGISECQIRISKEPGATAQLLQPVFKSKLLAFDTFDLTAATNLSTSKETGLTTFVIRPARLSQDQSSQQLPGRLPFVIAAPL